MMYKRNTRRSDTQTVVNIPELVSGSSTQNITQQHTLKMPKQVRQLFYFMPTNGFTLIELLVVVLIIGILAAVAVPQYQKAVEKSRATEALTLLKALRDQQAVCFLEYGVGSDHCMTAEELFSSAALEISGEPDSGCVEDYGLMSCGPSTKDFSYVIDRMDIFAVRKPWWTKYYLIYSYPDSQNISCVNKDESRNWCQMIGF